MKQKCFVFLPGNFITKKEKATTQDLRLFENLIKPALEKKKYSINTSQFVDNKEKTTIHVIAEICKCVITIVDLTDKNNHFLYNKIIKNFPNKYFILLLNPNSKIEVKSRFHKKITINSLSKTNVDKAKNQIINIINEIENSDGFGTDNAAFIMISLNKAILSTSVFQAILNSLFTKGNKNDLYDAHIDPEEIKKILKDYFKKTIVNNLILNHHTSEKSNHKPQSTPKEYEKKERVANLRSEKYLKKRMLSLKNEYLSTLDIDEHNKSYIEKLKETETSSKTTSRTT